MASADSPDTFLIRTIRLFRRAKWGIFLILFLAVHYFALNNFILLARDMIYGDSSDRGLFPAPLYPPWTIPANAATRKHQAAGRIGGDFAVVYFPAQEPDSLGNGYDPAASPDPWGRVSHYAPLVEFLCSRTICALDFGYACLFNLLIQLGLFYLTTFFVFRSLGNQKYFWFFLLFTDFCLFLTPVGLTWFESGQFSLYVAASYPLLLLGMEKKQAVWIAASAVFAFIKWISLPFTAVAFAMYLLTAKNRRELLYGVFNTLLFISVFALLSIPFPHDTLLFIGRLVYQESHSTPQGLSLAIYLPRFVVKALPLLLALAGYGIARISRSDFTRLIPFLSGAAVMLLLFPTLDFDYSVPTILGLIPLMLFWTHAHGSDLPPNRNLIFWIFVFFIGSASFSTALTGSTPILIILYLVFSAALMVSPLLRSKDFGRPGPEEPGSA